MTEGGHLEHLGVKGELTLQWVLKGIYGKVLTGFR